MTSRRTVKDFCCHEIMSSPCTIAAGTSCRAVLLVAVCTVTGIVLPVPRRLACEAGESVGSAHRNRILEVPLREEPLIVPACSVTEITSDDADTVLADTRRRRSCENCWLAAFCAAGGISMQRRQAETSGGISTRLAGSMMYRNK